MSGPLINGKTYRFRDLMDEVDAKATWIVSGTTVFQLIPYAVLLIRFNGFFHPLLWAGTGQSDSDLSS